MPVQNAAEVPLSNAPGTADTSCSVAAGERVVGVATLPRTLPIPIVHLLRPFLIPYESDDTARYPTMHFTTAKGQQWQKFKTLMSADNVHVFISVGR